MNPLFELLGWDIYNKKGRPEQYKEVVDEPSLEVEGGTKAPDYAFRLGEITKFYVEAKKPSVKITTDPLPAFQLKRYAWSAKLPLSILTNFEDISVYDCRFKPDKSDNATKGRILHIDFQSLEERWDELADIFSPEAIWQGSFDKYIDKKKRGTSEVDTEILKEIEGWREELAKNIALRNPDLTIEEMNFAVQRLIDRILFLRICEDRGTEKPDQLIDMLERGSDYYKHLFVIFQQADTKYNSGLFHLQYDKKRKTKIDRITPFIKVDDKVIASIIWDLYYPRSPYQFDVIPADILGHVYEQFLGKVIRLTAGHRAKVEEKPEVKKAGGVYYTPTYIVDYIVENTIGKLCENKSLEEMASIKILDPACGSGSFLIVAYKRMLTEHLKWYEANKPKKHKDQVFKNQKGAWQLTLKEKKRILLNNIFGVDIDSQAVEVTKLNLLLKALEGESMESVNNISKWFGEPALPDLGTNIKCGNSLIDFDIIDHLQELDDEERDKELARINPFSWEAEFPDIMKAGGFDAVVGNPPYIRIQTMKEWAPIEVEHYKRVYQSASKGNYDIYVVFVEKGLSLLNKTGKLGYILPHKFFQAQFGKSIRKLISSRMALNEIVHFGHNQIFQNATTYTCLLFLTTQPNNNFRFVSVNDISNHNILFEAIEKYQNNVSYVEENIPVPVDSDVEWNFSTGPEKRLLEKLKTQQNTLGDITRKIFVGLQTSADKIYVLNVKKWKEKTVICYSKSLNRDVEIEVGLVKSFLMGKDVHKYEPPDAKNVVIFPYNISDGQAVLLSQEYLKENYPSGWEYLIENKEALSNRESGKMKGDNFYAYIYPKNLAEFERRKIMTPEIAFGCQLSLDMDGTHYHTTKVYSFIFNENQEENILYFLGVLNSKTLWKFLTITGYTLRGGYYVFKTAYLKPFPYVFG